MAFDLTRINRYLASDANMDYIDGADINSYAQVISISSNSILINAASKIVGGHQDFVAGAEIFVHVSGSRNGTDKAYLGVWAFAEITSVSGSTLTIDRNITGTIPNAILNNYHVQAITVPFFNARDASNPVLNNISPPAFDTTKMCGGILVLKCVKFYLGGSGSAIANHSIILTDKGIPTTYSNAERMRPWLAYELDGMKDTDPHAGWENAMLEHRLPLNVGDGAALIYASNAGSISYVNNIGSTLGGVRYCRGATDSPNKPTNATNIGGSTALIIFRNRDPTTEIYHDMAAKYRSTSLPAGRGLGARMFVSKGFSKTHSNDGALYSHMTIHKEIPSNLRLANLFGNGSIANCSGSAAQTQMNNYAKITTTSANATYNVKKVSYTGKTTTGVAALGTGALALVTIFNTVTWHTVDTVLCNIVADDGSNFTLDKSINLGANRQAMIMSVPQFKNFTLSGVNTATPAYDHSKGVGGIFAIAVSNLCDISAGSIGVTKGGVPINISDWSLVERNDILTLGSGMGSILILAKTLTMSTNTRLGMRGENHGNKLGGRGCNGTVNGTTVSTSVSALGGGYRGANSGGNIGGSGNAGGTGGHTGGFLSSGSRDAGITGNTDLGKEGAHIMLIADTINNFNINAISTGGGGWHNGYHAGAGYGGGGAGNGAGGGFRGGGSGDFGSGGGAGYCFVWCNNAVNQVMDGIVLDD